MAYRTEKISLKLDSPCFLGDADQKGVWRTPPLKALLREWWRIAVAPVHDYDHRRIREAEGKLLGNAWLENKNSQSQVRLALAHWQTGKMTRLDTEPEPQVHHREVGQGGRNVGALLYLGYGPLQNDRAARATLLKSGAALQADEKNTLSLAYPEASEDEITRTLQLIDWFGTLGGRSRNGWGSLDLAREALTRKHPTLNHALRPLERCLELDWPHAIGEDESGPLVWESQKTFENWKDAMQFLAKTKIGFRTHDKLSFDGIKDGQFTERHILAYPVTHHAVLGPLSHDKASLGWVEPSGKDRRPKTDRQGYLVQSTRLANQIRCKLIRATEGHRLQARIYHTPCNVPEDLIRLLSHADQEAIRIRQLAVWQAVHDWLDTPANGLERLKG